MIKGILRITFLTLIILGLNLLILNYLPGLPFGEKFYPVLTFFFLQSIVIHVLFKFGQSTLDLAVQLLVMATMTIRLLTALIAVSLFIYIGVNDMVNFIVTFFAIYLFYFVFEIITVLSNLRSNLK